MAQLWHPDTCDCTLVCDPADGEAIGFHTHELTGKTTICDYHASLGHDHHHVSEMNRRKNFAIAHLQENHGIDPQEVKWGVHPNTREFVLKHPLVGDQVAREAIAEGMRRASLHLKGVRQRHAARIN